jgi:large subunit ribosomal protein L4
MAELEIFDGKGKSVGKHKLAEPIAELTVNNMVLHRTVVAEQANSRQGTQSTKTRSDARGGGRKPYKQKKTGNARQGTIRAPHYTGGGVAFAPKPRDYNKKVNRKERRLAIMAAFGAQANDGVVSLCKELKFAAPKTKDAADFLASLGLADCRRVLLVVPAYDEMVVKSFRNLKNVVIRTAPSRDGLAQSFSARDLLVAHKIVMTEDAMKKTEECWLK